MNFSAIKKRVASNIGLVDSSGDILASKNISETDIGNWVNDRYQDIFTVLSAQYPEDFERKTFEDFYRASGTIGSVSDTTLNSSSSIFEEDMVGSSIYNSNEDEALQITGYTDGDTVTMESDMEDSEWEAGDTIYVLGTQFAVGASISDMRNIRWVGVAYDSDDVEDDNYRECDRRNFSEMFKVGNETFSELSPVYYLTSHQNSSGDLEDVLGIEPEPSEAVTNGIKIVYAALPSDMSADADTPRLPLGSHHVLVLGATADAYRKEREPDKANDYEVKYESKRAELVANYPLTRGHMPAKARPPRKIRRMLDRYI